MAYRNYSTAVSHIVDATGQGDFTTIAAALTAAVSGQTIFIRPGTYTENLTLVTGVDIVSFPGEGNTGNVIINGNCTLSTAGIVTISGIQLKTNSAAILTVSGSVASILNLVGCNLNMGTTAIVYSSSSSSSQVNIYNCTGNISAGSVTPINMSSTGALTMSYCNITNIGASTTATTMSAGTATFNYNNLQFAITNSSTAGITSAYNTFNTAAINTTPFTIGGSGTNTSQYDTFLAGTASGISAGGTLKVIYGTVSSSNTNAVTGGGTLTTIGLNFIGTSHLNNATTTTGSGPASGLTKGVLPAAGQIGEVISTTFSVGTSGSVTTMGSLNLTPGNWSVTGLVMSTGVGSNVSFTAFITTANNASGPLIGTGADAQGFGNNSASPTLTIPSYPYSISANTTIYLTCNLGGGAGTGTGYFSAVRTG